MRSISRFFQALLVGLVCCTQGFTQDSLQETFPHELAFTEPVDVELVAEDLSIEPGRPFWIAIHFEAEEGWHLYWKNPGDAGAPPEIDWNLPEGFTTGPLLWPAPTHFKVSEFSGLGYEESFTLLVQIIPPMQLSEKTVSLKADIQWVACRGECIPGMPSVELTMPVKQAIPEKNVSKEAFFEKTRGLIPQKMQATAEYMDNQLLLHFAAPQFQIERAFFFPEQQGLVNLSIDPLVSIDGSSASLQIPLADTTQINGQQVSGVLLLYEKNGQAHASEIEILTSQNKHQRLSEQTASIALGNGRHLSLESSASESSQLSETGIEDTGMGLGLAILAAFAGGLLLNLMPCVLPVLSLKVLSVVQAAGDSRLERYKQGFAYVIGVLLSFWVLAGLLLLLRASGEEIGWGFQLQEPIFVGVLACMLFLMALNLFGVFEWGTSFAAISGNSKTKRSGVGEALWSGVLATIIATPCTGPFLGASLGFAMALPPIGSFALFTVMGLGMALPFLLLTISPPLLRLLPKPGQWMVTLKQGMGFLLVASVLWLIWVWEAQTDFMSVMALLGALFILSIGGWCYGNWGQLNNSFKSRILAVCAATSTLVVAIMVVVQAAGQDTAAASNVAGEKEHFAHLTSSKTSLNLGWENFSSEKLQELSDKGVPVFIDFTAKWCLLCQANKVVLNSSSVVDTFNQENIVRMRADWTKKDPEITRLLKSYKRSGVPLYVLYVPGKSPKIFPETLTSDMLIEAAKEMKS